MYFLGGLQHEAPSPPWGFIQHNTVFLLLDKMFDCYQGLWKRLPWFYGEIHIKILNLAKPIYNVDKTFVNAMDCVHLPGIKINTDRQQK